jgi:diaminopimelate decarboxylase
MSHEELAERFGTPLYVYDLDLVEAARRDLFSALPEAVDLFYAIKANPHPQVAAALSGGEGRRCRAEISSTGELSTALSSGFLAHECLYTGPGKTAVELHDAIGRGVRLFSVESPGDLHRIGKVAGEHGVVADCLLRINSATASASTSIRMTGKPTQFGLDSETLPDVIDQLRSVPGTRVIGAHFFPLSNATDEESLVAEFQGTIAVAARMREELGLDLRMVDIGGGFAAPYAAPGERPVYGKLSEHLADALDQHLPGWRRREPHVTCESGRHLVGSAGVFLCSVVNVKESRGSTFVVVDAGINAFGGMSGLGRLLPVCVEVDPDEADADRMVPVSLVGPLCTPGDLLGRRVMLPSPEPGDLLTIPNAGAYGLSASLLSFLGRPTPVEVVVRSGQVLSASRLELHRSWTELSTGSVPAGAADR